MPKIKSPQTIRALPMAASVAALVLLCTSGCAVYEDPRPPMRAHVPPQAQAYPYAEPEVVSVYVEPPMSEPEPIAVPWAPPPMLRELPPPMPYPGAVWVGGYWVWQGNWVWATGRWVPPPRPDYAWVQPYYEHRDGVVIFITGHWCPPGVAFVPPPRGQRFNVMVASPGVRPGYAPVGPPGVFLPPPPGSRPGLIVPAPMGTPPGVMRGAPPVVNVGMRIQNTVNDTRTTNVTNNITNVTIVAPAGATSTGRPFMSAVSGQPVRPDTRQGGAMPTTRPSQEGPAPTLAPTRPQPDRASPVPGPAPVPSWRAGAGQPMPAQDQARDQGVPREDGWRPARIRDRNPENPPERGQERMSAEPQRRQVQAAPAPVPAAPVMQAEPHRRDDRARMEAPPARAATESVPPPKREEDPRRRFVKGQKGEQDKKDAKGE